MAVRAWVRLDVMPLNSPPPPALAKNVPPSQFWDPTERKLPEVWDPGNPSSSQESLNLRELQILLCSLGWFWNSGSQREACSWPLEPQEGNQTPGEGGREGVNEFL